jgi:hypothetical protein
MVGSMRAGESGRDTGRGFLANSVRKRQKMNRDLTRIYTHCQRPEQSALQKALVFRQSDRST